MPQNVKYQRQIEELRADFDAFQAEVHAGDLDDPAVGAKVMKYMADNPEFTQKHGEKAFMEAAKILRIVPQESRADHVGSDDSEVGALEDHEVAALEEPENGAKVHRFMMENPEFTQQHGERAFMEAARRLKIIG